MSKQKSWLLYGATGYTGKHIAEKAVACGYKPVLAGRNGAEVKALAERLGLAWCAIGLDDMSALTKVVKDFSAVMNAAGPFAFTGLPMAEACIAAGTHYLDITGEVPVFEDLAALDERARKAGIMILPGCGFDMVPGDRLALYLKRMMPDATSLDVAISFEGTLTRGTIRSTLVGFSPEIRIRRAHQLTTMPTPTVREFDFGPGRCGGRTATNATTFGDISTGWRTTGLPEITVFLRPAKEFAALASLKSIDDVAALPDGPSQDELNNIPTILIGEVRNQAGKALAARLVLPQIYTITFDLAAKIAQRVSEGTCRAGFQTPASVFGEDFILEFDGCTLEPWTPGSLPG